MIFCEHYRPFPSWLDGLDCCSARYECRNYNCLYKKEPDPDLVEDPAWYNIEELEEEVVIPPGPAAPAGILMQERR